MRFPLMHREPPPSRPGVVGQVRLGPSTRNVLRRLNPGDIAMVDAVDLDTVTAESLLRAKVAGVVNLAPSVSGRYPAGGAQVLVEAGVPLLDDVGPDVLGRVTDGDVVRLDGRELLVGNRVVAEGQVQTATTVAAAMGEAGRGLRVQLDAFAGGAHAFVAAEADLLLAGEGLPTLRTDMAGRPVLVVARGPRDAADVAAVELWRREQHPVLVAVGGGADVLVAAGLRPDVVVGDMDEVGDEALRSGAELVVHALRDGRVLGLDRARSGSAAPLVVTSDATSEDLAILLAVFSGASLVVTAGTADGLVELLDRDRTGMPSTVLTRLRAGGTVVDANAAAQLYRSGIPAWQVFVLLAAGLVAVVAAVLTTPVGQGWLDGWPG